MAALKDIVYKVTLKTVAGDMNKHVASVCFDSRQCNQGDIFVAVKGTQVDGHQFIDKVIDMGATTVVCEVMPLVLKPEVTYIQTDNSAKALGIIASNFYNNPSSKLKLVAITGTNGKTTTATLLHKLFLRLGYQVGLLSTIVNKINDEEIPSTHTTPDAIQLNKLLNEMVERGCTYCFMEASSHAIVQHRMAGIEVAGAIFTNISHDHLDYHGTFDEYIKAKKKLFDELPANAFALVNIDDNRGLVMLQNTKASKNSFALKTMANYKAKVLSNTLQGLELDIEGKQVWFQLVGDFNAYNLLGVYGAAVLLNQDPDEVLTQLSVVTPAPGRFELVRSSVGITAIVDYAHTPDALENVLSTIEKFRTGNEQVITVVGCGGNRDKTKRPLMAALAAKLSDRVIITSDNPRDEEPEQIIKEMQAGVSISLSRKVLSITDRKEAIKTACALAKPKDIILVAGKGHETYQEIKGVKYDFDDRIILRDFLD